jgi:hypothetical protein
MRKTLWLLLLPVVFVFVAAVTSRAEGPRLHGRLGKVMFVEVFDNSGQCILKGGQLVLTNNYVHGEDEDNVVDQYRFKLRSTGVVDEADGLAYILLDKEHGEIDEHAINIELDDLPAETHYTLFINGEKLADFDTDDEGEANVRLKLVED